MTAPRQSKQRYRRHREWRLEKPGEGRREASFVTGEVPLGQE